MTRPGRQEQVVRSPALGTAQHQGHHAVCNRQRRLVPDFVSLASTPSVAARLTSSTGIGTRTKSRTRASRSSDHRSPVHDATNRTSARCSSRAATVMWKDSSVLCERPDLGSPPRPLGTRVRVTGFDAISRSGTAQAKTDHKDARNRLTDDSASPERRPCSGGCRRCEHQVKTQQCFPRCFGGSSCTRLLFEFQQDPLDMRGDRPH